MYYSSGNYEAFARPRKPEGVDRKSAYIIGSGLAALTAACYLVRDGQMKGERVHVFEKDPLPGGACDVSLHHILQFFLSSLSDVSRKRVLSDSLLEFLIFLVEFFLSSL